MDGDGDIDVLSAQFAHRIKWYESDGGSFFNVLNVCPDSVRGTHTAASCSGIGMMSPRRDFHRPSVGDLVEIQSPKVTEISQKSPVSAKAPKYGTGVVVWANPPRLR